MTVHELIGKKVEIIKSKNKSNIGLKGKITDETKNTITLDNEKKLIKNNITMKIDGKILEGSDLVFRPEDRIKRVKKA